MWSMIYKRIFRVNKISFTKEQIFTDASWCNSCMVHRQTLRLLFSPSPKPLLSKCQCWGSNDILVKVRIKERWNVSARGISECASNLCWHDDIVFGGCKRICLTVTRLSHIVLHSGGVRSKMCRSPNRVKVEQCFRGGINFNEDRNLTL